ncbi:MAG: hypothetical protein IPK60_13625 [Sandaracinaceae bacterium]|jgi:hypothetical protein|nr:hypothetical protein [Sandaracinaceae bacterium]
MAVKSKAALAKEAANQPIVEELHFRSDSAFLCLLLNRRTKIIRVIDFRAGALPAKRLFIQSIAQREGIEKVLTLVEKDEVSSWTRVGFVREGTIPGFYKRSDGHLCGCVIGDRTASIEVSDEGLKFAEKTIVAAKKNARDLEDDIKGITLKGVEAKLAFAARDTAWQKAEGLGGFDTFGRGVLRLFLEAQPKKGRANYLSAEFQDCFGHALVEVLRTPKEESETLAVAAGLRAFCEELKRRGIVSAFGFGASDDQELATSYLSAGFRKTGLLARGIQVGKERRDAILWTRKLLNPAGDELEAM